MGSQARVNGGLHGCQIAEQMAFSMIEMTVMSLTFGNWKSRRGTVGWWQVWNSESEFVSMLPGEHD